ncbi:hypothetical protein V6N11_063272 [Hibiscus sabdariffa]|uniref:Reverse transcriptase zinc-binding domain-containing protein n=1 Tax=Hibiscus sabdariffa TaxID=183260 RepID=A0ABR2NGL1_9ROSI
MFRVSLLFLIRKPSPISLVSNALALKMNRLMTNAERFHRSISSDSSCFDCGNQLETSLHVLPDCHATRNLWLQILPGALIRPFFECDLHQWLSCNLAAAILHPHSSLPWNLVFASLTWQIWKRQNGLIFHNPDLSNDALIIRRNLAWVKHYSAWVARETGSNFDLRSVPLESLNFGSSYSSFTPEKLGYYCVLDTEIGQSPCGCFSKAC